MIICIMVKSLSFVNKIHIDKIYAYNGNFEILLVEEDIREPTKQRSRLVDSTHDIFNPNLDSKLMQSQPTRHPRCDI